ncbi:hypothetical protein [Chroococcidiopsis sp [FACHB-1243]]|nr:hypothetical protein [Chroococcidiopsis sp. [FACHB-1243]]
MDEILYPLHDPLHAIAPLTPQSNVDARIAKKTKILFRVLNATF